MFHELLLIRKNFFEKKVGISLFCCYNSRSENPFNTRNHVSFQMWDILHKDNHFGVFILALPLMSWRG